MIAKSLLTLVAPILTYTADEILENFPAIIKGDAEDIFDLEYEPLHVSKSGFNEAYMLKARDAFFEIVDTLKKEKIIKSTLEVEISTGSNILLSMDAIEAEDWFVVSSVNGNDVTSDELGHFSVDGDEFVVVKAVRAKCPRCWKFQAANEECLCERCAKVVNA